MNKAKLQLITSMTIFGTIGLFVRYIPLSSSAIAFARGLIGSLFLIAFLSLKKEKIQFSSIRSSFMPLALSGILIGINWILLFESYKYTSIATATLCYYFAPIFVMIASVFLFKEHLSINKIICIVVAFIGMIFVSGILEIKSFNLLEMKGVLLGLAAALLYATVVLMNKYIRNIKSYDKTLIQLSFAALIMFVYILITKEYEHIQLTLTSGILLVVVGIIHTGLAYTLYFSSIEHLDSQTIGLMSYIDPIVAIILSVCLLHESLTLLSIIGAIMVLGSTCINEIINK